DAKCAILLIKKKLFIYTQDLGINHYFFDFINRFILTAN
ncbi:hypothetical protein LCGC14_2466840, partial [marine sediment metagenome]